VYNTVPALIITSSHWNNAEWKEVIIKHCSNDWRY